MTTANGSCTSANSQVSWTFATGTSGTSHTLTAPLTIAANGQPNNPLTVTLTGDAAMTSATPAGCANTYFAMPALTAVTASGGAATATTSPATNGWTS